MAEAGAAAQQRGGAAAQRRVARVLWLEHELARIARASAAAGVDLVVLKGAPLARQLFAGPANRLREQRDNDLLVRRRDLRPALGVLEQLGYRLPHSYRHCDPLAAATPEWQLPLLRQTESGGALLAELHWAAFPPRLFPVPEDEVWSHTAWHGLRDGTPVRVLDRTLTLIHLASHYVQHVAASRWILDDFATGWNRWASELGAEAVALRAAELGLRDVLEYTLAHAAQLGLLSIPGPKLLSGKARVLARLLSFHTGHADHAGNADHAGHGLGDAAQRARTAALALLARPNRIPGALAAEVWPPLTTMARLHDMAIGPRLIARYAMRPLRPLLRVVRARNL